MLAYVPSREFIFAENGQAALDELQRHPDIDVVLTDLHMPVMDGLTLLGRIPEVNPMARTVIVTAYGDMHNIRAALNRGAFDFLLKPIDFSDLEATVEKIAANAVMAGCEPKMMRALIPLLRAVCDERFNVHGIQATTHFA